MTCCTGCCFHDPDRGACTYRGQGSDQCWPGGDTCPCRATGHVSQAVLKGERPLSCIRAEDVVE